MAESPQAERTVVVAVPLSLPGAGSAVAEAAVAVLVRTVPPAIVGATWTIRMKTALPGAKEAFEHEIVPPAPTAGVVQLHPAGEASEPNVVPAGSVSASVVVAALLGPAFATVSV